MAQTESAYKPKIVDLMNKHSLGFLHNPGGGEFTHAKFGSCQVHMMGNYKEDHEKLLNWLKEKGLE